jgi:hypothetical protein
MLQKNSTPHKQHKHTNTTHTLANPYPPSFPTRTYKNSSNSIIIRDQHSRQIFRAHDLAHTLRACCDDDVGVDVWREGGNEALDEDGFADGEEEGCAEESVGG